MPDGLLVIVGAEASILVFLAAMTLYAKRMDVLSGRSFERSVVSPTDSRHPLRPIRRKPRDLLRLLRKWIDLAALAPPDLLRRPDITRTPRSSFQTRLQTPSGLCRAPVDEPRPLDASGRPAAEADRQRWRRRIGRQPRIRAVERCYLPANSQRSLNARST